MRGQRFSVEGEPVSTRIEAEEIECFSYTENICQCLGKTRSLLSKAQDKKQKLLCNYSTPENAKDFVPEAFSPTVYSGGIFSIIQACLNCSGINIWRIENFDPVPVPESSHGKFFMGDAYIILKTTDQKNGALCHDIHYWLGKDTSQDEAGTAAIKAMELDAALGGRAVQYRELQGLETKKFLSYFRPCIIPQPGGVASRFKHVKVNEDKHETRLYICKGKHVVHIKEVPFARSTLNHYGVFILDTKSKIFQFNGSNSSVQERAKALEVVQYIKDTFHEGKCDIAAIEDGMMMSDADAGEFWSLFGGFAPLQKKTPPSETGGAESFSTKLLCVEKGKPHRVNDADALKRDMLDTNKCYLLDCGNEVYLWIGRNTSLEERKSAAPAAEKLIGETNRSNCHVIRVVEGFETIIFKSKFKAWPEKSSGAVPEPGRGKVASLLKRQGMNVEGLKKDEPSKEEPLPYIDCTGELQVWHINDKEKELLSESNQSKFYSGSCYIFQYGYAGEEKDEHLIGTWFGKKSVKVERASAISHATKLFEALKSQAVQTRLHEGYESIQFFSIIQSIIFYKGGLSTGYKNYIKENKINDDTYSEDGLALFRVQGYGPENMQAIQVEPVASSLNSSYCYILHKGTNIFAWFGSRTNSDEHELLERYLDQIKPNLQYKTQKDGKESPQFWSLLGGENKHPTEKIKKELESDPHLFYCDFSNDNLKVTEIYNFVQDDLMTEDMYILDCHTDLFVWIGQQTNSKIRSKALHIGEVFIGQNFLQTKQSPETPILIVMEGHEPSFFTRFFLTWDSAKSLMHGNSYQRKLAIMKPGSKTACIRPTDRPKRRISSYGGRTGVTDKSSRSRSMSVSPDSSRARARSPAFNALAANFEKPHPRNLSTPPPAVTKLYPKSSSADSSKVAPASRSSAIAALTASYESAKETIESRKFRGGLGRRLADKSSEKNANEGSISRTASIDGLIIQEDVNEGEDEDEGTYPTFPYERLITTAKDPAPGIDATKREVYLSVAEFKEKFGMKMSAFNALPKWKKNKLKLALNLF